MKKNIAIIILSVVLALSVVYGFIATMAARSFSSENDDLITENKKLLEQYSDVILNNDPPVTLKAVGNVISDSATTHKINDDTVLIIVSYNDNIIDKAKEYASSIPVVLKTAEYKTCIIMVVDDNNDCKFGWTIHSDGNSKAFIGE